MSNPPPLVPSYGQPEKPQPVPIARKNRAWMVSLRVLAGGMAGAGAMFLALWWGLATQHWPLAALPISILFAAGFFISLKYKRFGYAGGVVLGAVLGFIVALVVEIIIFFCVTGGKVV